MKRSFKDKSWYPYTVAVCSGVILYVILTNLPTVGSVMKEFGGYFGAVVVGCIVAYLMNPLAKFFQRTLFRKVKKSQWLLSVGLAILSVFLALALLIITLIPQLIESVGGLTSHLADYQSVLAPLLDQMGSSQMDVIDDMARKIMGKTAQFLQSNLGDIAKTSASVVMNTVNWVIGIVLSIYLLAAKDSLKAGCGRLLKALLPEKRYEKLESFLVRCDSILIRYLIFSLLDSVIVAVLNLIFMLIAGLPYAGLLSVMVGLTNLIPNFGPVIAAVIGGFILLLVDPWYMVLFVIFTIVLQVIDGYIIKPKLFGSSLGVSGLLILVSVVVMGNIFGLVGILLAIPVAAILDFIYREEFMPWLERRRAMKNAASAGDASPADAPPVDASPADAPPIDVSPADAPPVDASSVDAPPVDASPADAPLVDAPPADLRTAETEEAAAGQRAELSERQAETDRAR